MVELVGRKFLQKLSSILICMQDSFARARTRPSARATIGYLVYKILITNNHWIFSYFTFILFKTCLIYLVSSSKIFLRKFSVICCIKWSKLIGSLILCIVLLPNFPENVCMQDTFARARTRPKVRL